MINSNDVIQFAAATRVAKKYMWQAEAGAIDARTLIHKAFNQSPVPSKKYIPDVNYKDVQEMAKKLERFSADCLKGQNVVSSLHRLELNDTTDFTLPKTEEFNEVISEYGKLQMKMLGAPDFSTAKAIVEDKYKNGEIHDEEYFEYKFAIPYYEKTFQNKNCNMTMKEDLINLKH